MSTPFLGEIRMFGGNFAPLGWAFCSGQTLSIAQNDALFALIGTTYGGDGVNTFALPDLRSRVPVHQGSGLVIGQIAGEENVTLTVAQIPSHTHGVQGTTATATSTSPAGNLPAAASVNVYTPPGANPAPVPVPMLASAISGGGGGQPHSNIMPYQCVSFIIALQGVFPSRN